MRIFNPSNLSNYSTANHMKPIKRDLSPIKRQIQSPGKKRVMEIDDKIDLSLAIKEELAAVSYRDRARVNEVAEVVQLMVDAVEQGRTSIHKKHDRIINRALEERMFRD